GLCVSATRESAPKRSPLVGCKLAVRVGFAPQRDLQLDRLAPGAMHPLDILGRMSFRAEKWLNGVVNHWRKRYHVPQWNVRGGFYVVRLVLFFAGVVQRDFLLIFEPVLIVAAETGVQNPLPEPQPALG